MRKTKTIKFIPALLLMVFSSCGSSVIYVKQPIPIMRLDLNRFNKDLIGEYLVTDSIVDELFLDAINELYNPEIILETDTSVLLTFHMKIVISKHAIISKKILTGYMFKPFYDSLDKKDSALVDKITLVNDTVKVTLKELSDTLFNLEQQDILRRFKGHYLLNIKTEEAYQPILLSKISSGSLLIKDFEKYKIVNYYQSCSSNKSINKAEMINNGEGIKMKNSELKKFIKYDCFGIRYSLKKIIQPVSLSKIR